MMRRVLIGMAISLMIIAGSMFACALDVYATMYKMSAIFEDEIVFKGLAMHLGLNADDYDNRLLSFYQIVIQ